jgi:hypothetical protein
MEPNTLTGTGNDQHINFRRRIRPGADFFGRLAIEL